MPMHHMCSCFEVSQALLRRWEAAYSSKLHWWSDCWLYASLASDGPKLFRDKCTNLPLFLLQWCCLLWLYGFHMTNDFANRSNLVYSTHVYVHTFCNSCTSERISQRSLLEWNLSETVFICRPSYIITLSCVGKKSARKIGTKTGGMNGENQCEKGAAARSRINKNTEGEH